MFLYIHVHPLVCFLPRPLSIGLIMIRNLILGESALTCYLHACRNQSEAKCRKYLARIIWMLSYDDEKVGSDQKNARHEVHVPFVDWS